MLGKGPTYLHLFLFSGNLASKGNKALGIVHLQAALGREKESTALMDPISRHDHVYCIAAMQTALQLALCVYEGKWGKVLELYMCRSNADYSSYYCVAACADCFTAGAVCARGQVGQGT